MAELAAVGLAGNILGFIDFAFKLFTATRTIYRSASDATSDNSTLEIIARDVEYHCDKLGEANSADSSQLSAITNESRRIAEELRVRVQKVRDEAAGSKWGSFRLALRDVFKGNEVSALLERLSNINKQITAHLLQSMIAQQEQLATQFNGVAIEIKSRDVRLENFIAMVREDLKRAARVTKDRETEITSKLDRCLETLNKREDEMFQSATLLSPSYSAFSPSLDSQSDFVSFYALQSDRGKLIAHYQAIKALEFDDIRSRETQIDHAHAETFGWVLDESQSDISFVRWLGSSGSTYWIQGKPGAGKSTLMKYICEQPKTYEHLERWAQGKSLITAKYFSWFAGTELQKSLEGLLRSLLFDIFTKRPLLVRDTKVLENEKFKYALRKGTWNTRILGLLLQRLIEQTPAIRYCFFIDGLDEFGERHADLINTLDSLTKYENVKLCLSSRPLREFDDAYGEDVVNQLKLESLTLNDIKSFVVDKLGENRLFRMKLRTNPLYQNLMTQPVDKASGVFLWVVLVVRSLLEGLTNGDSIEDLEHRVAEFPGELKDSLVYILRSVDERYRKETAEAFRIALVYEDAIPLILFSALFEMKSNLTWPIQLRCGPYSRDKILEMYQDAHRKLDARCKGLLEVVEPAQVPESHPASTVHWLHRCVKEFVTSSEEIERILGDDMKRGPNARLLVCGAYLGVTKWLPNYKEDLTISNSFDSIIFGPFCTTADRLYRREPDPLGMSATESDVQTLHGIVLELEMTIQERWPAYYAALAHRALELGWGQYIEYRMKTNYPVLAHIKSQLLAYALSVRGHDLNPDIIRILLEHGANPNEQLGSGATRTPWTTALMRYAWEKWENNKKPEDRKKRDDGKPREDHDLGKTATALQILAANGADPDVRISVNAYFPHIKPDATARELVEDYDGFSELRGIRFKTLEPEPDLSPGSWLLGWFGWLWRWKDWVIGIKAGS